MPSIMDRILAFGPVGRFYLRRRRDYRAVFKTNAGRRVLADIFAACRMGEEVGVPGDDGASRENVGRQAVGWHIAGMLEQSPRDILKAVQADYAPHDDAADFEDDEDEGL